MKCYLHIGPQKTATTTIQNFLSLNRELLLKNGLAFPISLGNYNNRKLPLAAYNLNRRDDLTLRLGIRSDSDLQKCQQKIIEDLKHELDGFRRDGIDRIIFSSEHLHSRLMLPSEVQRLRQILDYIGITSLKVILYLRNPPDIACSLYSTQVKGGSTASSPPFPDNAIYRHNCDHRHTLRRFSECFGDSNIFPRIFDKSHFKNGSLLEDFSELIDEHVHFPNFLQPVNQNESLSFMAIEVLRRVNVFVPCYVDGNLNAARADIASIIARHFPRGRYSLSEELHRNYVEAFFDSNEWVHDRYFPGLVELFPTDFGVVDSFCVNSNELDELARLISYCWLRDVSKGGLKNRGGA